jgi:hypothetical protein
MTPTSDGLEFGIQVLEYDVKWKIKAGEIYVYDVIDYDRAAIQLKKKSTH